MEVPSQPRPDAPAPPPGPEAERSRFLFQCILAVGVVSAILSVWWVIAPLFIRDINRRDLSRTEATNNIRRVHLCLFNFDSDYGRFPGASTIADVQDSTDTDVPLGTSSSNELLRQLIAAGEKNERIFWAQSSITPRPPDNKVVGSQALEKGECSFAYVAGLSASSDGGTPILMAPMNPAKRCFERRKDYKGCAVILFIDGSARSFPIDEHDKVELGGMDFFDPRQPHWGGKVPDIKWPE